MRTLTGLLILVTISGCSSISHELQPHRLWRWNYQDAPSRTDDALFSIDDPLILPCARKVSEANGDSGLNIGTVLSKDACAELPVREQ